jgi:hypothetical protein
MTDYPGATWVRGALEDVRLDGVRLDRARWWLDAHAGERGYRLAVGRDGRLVYEQHRGFDPGERLAIASAAKSIYSPSNHHVSLTTEESYDN